MPACARSRLRSRYGPSRIRTAIFHAGRRGRRVTENARTTRARDDGATDPRPALRPPQSRVRTRAGGRRNERSPDVSARLPGGLVTERDGRRSRESRPFSVELFENIVFECTEFSDSVSVKKCCFFTPSSSPTVRRQCLRRVKNKHFYRSDTFSVSLRIKTYSKANVEKHIRTISNKIK